MTRIWRRIPVLAITVLTVGALLSLRGDVLEFVDWPDGERAAAPHLPAPSMTTVSPVLVAASSGPAEVAPGAEPGRWRAA
jgi:hypothetical protein